VTDKRKSELATEFGLPGLLTQSYNSNFDNEPMFLAIMEKLSQLDRKITKLIQMADALEGK
jgi:hypothetical protein